jgi:arylsulfatase A-like enzyme
MAQRAGITTVGVSANPLIARATNLTGGFETFVEGGWERERKNWMPAARVNATFARWLGQNRGRRFLAYLHYMDPHDPYTPADHPPRPAGLSDEIAAGQVERVARAVLLRGRAPLAPPEVTHLRRLYGLEVHDWDAALAALLATLDAEGVRDSTAIVVVADHGEEFQEHGQMKHRLHLYDELVRVPFVAAGPGITAGRAREQVLGVDVFPTVAALLGVDVPPGLPGRNVLAAREPRPAFSETRYGVLPDGRRAALVSVRAGGWKLITAPDLGHAELYDLAHDPGEMEDRFGSAPEGATLAALLAAWEGSVPAPPPVTGHDPGLQRKLRALGYVE